PKLRQPGFVSDKRIPGGQSRWTQDRELDWNPVRPELVCEVRYDKLEKNRFRHGTRFIRFRQDKDPKDCTWREVRPPRRRGDPTDESCLASHPGVSPAEQKCTTFRRGPRARLRSKKCRGHLVSRRL